MKIALILSARSSSKRLPGKHFAVLGGSLNALDVLCGRLRSFLPSSDISICVATTTNSEDQVFKSSKDRTVYRGSIENIPLRQYDAARSLAAELIISVDGDDIFTAPEAILALIAKFTSTDGANKKFFYTTGLPLGMNASCYSTTYLGSLISGKENTKLETGWGRIFPINSRIEVPVHVSDFAENPLRFTLDYPEDLQFFSAVVQHFKDTIFEASTALIIEYVLRNKIYKINESVIASYWENFNREKSLEENASN